MTRNAPLLVAVLLACPTPSVAADPPVPADHAAKMSASQTVFKEGIRDFLTKNCLECHGGEKTKSGFDLSTRESLLKGGDGGPALVPGKAAESRVVKLVAREAEPHMPPKKPVAKEAVALLAKWIDLGAAYDRPLVGTTPAGGKGPLAVTDKDRQYWAYRPLQKVAPPAVNDAAWVPNPIDAFVRAKLDAAGVTPAPDADKRTLLRRVTFDLTGLPPTPEEVEAFVADASPDAYGKVVDRLLASPAYGERWARHWLDPARYAESHGFEHDYLRPNAYHYRDFVVRAFNADVPYDRFVRWQVAGDELAPGDPLALAATGFLGAGVYPTQITNREAERVRYDALDDMLATTGHAVLALTVGCARCHDHKYDPIPTKDYYRLLAAFTTTVRSEVEVDLGTPDQKAAAAAFAAKLKPLADELKWYEEKELPAALAAGVTQLKELPKIADGNAAKAVEALRGGKKWDQLPKPQRDAAAKWYAPRDEGWKGRKAKVDAAEKGRPPATTVVIQATTEGRKPMRHHTADGAIPDFYPKTYFLKRGDAEQKDGEATPGFLQVLSRKTEDAWRVPTPPGATTSFRRSALAKWLTDTDAGAGALAARVIVNRLWHHHFGRGIVATLNDFGLQGDPPTHPELLEWLAADLVAHGWALKRVHKLIVTSRTYRLSGAASDAGRRLDPDNRLWGHRPRRRLEAEAVRDNWLAVSGTLDRTMYGPGIADEGMRRRSLYFRVQRSQLPPVLQVFDWPDTLTSAAARPTTTVPPQALVFLNNRHVRAAAGAFAATLRPHAEKSLPAAVDRAYRAAFGRLPTAEETAAGVEYLSARASGGKLDRALQDYAIVLFGLNEFIYVD